MFPDVLKRYKTTPFRTSRHFTRIRTRNRSRTEFNSSNSVVDEFNGYDETKSHTRACSLKASKEADQLLLDVVPRAVDGHRVEYLV